MEMYSQQKHEGNKVLAHFSSAKEKNYQSRIIHPAKISCSNETDIKTVSKEEKLRQFVARDIL